MPLVSNGNTVPASYTTDRLAQPAFPPVAAAPPNAPLPPADGEPPLEVGVEFCEPSVVSPPQARITPQTATQHSLQESLTQRIEAFEEYR